MRRDTPENWTIKNPLLGRGELALNLDGLSFKVGDGSKRWNDLPYYEGIYFPSLLLI
jgi:hypothetical protein